MNKPTPGAEPIPLPEFGTNPGRLEKRLDGSFEPTATPLRCPSLGTWRDPGIFYAYPSGDNQCYSCRRPATPLLTHQQAYCLSRAYTDCPVFNQAESRPFPPKLREKEAEHNSSSATMTWLLGILIALAVIGLVEWRFFPQVFTLQGATPPLTATEDVVPSDTPLPSPTGTAEPSSTPPPTRTNLPWTHMLGQPFEADGRELLLIRVGAEDSFETIDAQYDTTSDVVRALNNSVNASLLPDTVIVLAPGMRAVDPTLPSFKVLQIVAPSISIDNVATQYHAETSSTRRYNGCTTACLLSVGDWVILPLTK